MIIYVVAKAKHGTLRKLDFPNFSGANVDLLGVIVQHFDSNELLLPLEQLVS